MKRVFIGIILIANLLCLGLWSCSLKSFAEDNSTIINGVRLKYINEIDIKQVYEHSNFEVSYGAGSANLQGVEDSVIDINVQYHEYSPGDASIYIEDGVLMTKSISGKPVSISKVLGKVPQSTNLRINAGTGDIVVSDMGSCDELSVDSGTGNIEISRTNVNKLSLSSGTGSITLNHVNGDVGEVSTGTGNIIINSSSISHKDFSVGTGRIIENRDQEKLMLK